MGPRVIFVAQSFPPVAGSHTTRTIAIASALAKEYDAIGLSLAVGKSHPIRDESVQSPIPVLRTFPGIGHSLAHGFKHKAQTYSLRASGVSTDNRKLFRAFTKLLKSCLRRFVVVDSYVDAIPHLAWRLRRTLQPTDLVVSSSMPNSTHVAVLLALVGKRNPWIVDFADPWTLDASRPTRGPRRMLESCLERRILARADVIAWATIATLDEYSRAYPSFAHKMRLVRMGFDAADTAIPAHCFDRPTAFYGGSLPGENRDATALLAICAELPSVDFVFAGACVPVVKAFFDGVIPKNVYCIDGLRHAEVISYIKGASISVLFGNSNPQQVPGKTYQYAAFAQRVLHIAPTSESETDSLLPAGSRTISNISTEILSALGEPWERVPRLGSLGFSWDSALVPLESAVRSLKLAMTRTG